MGAAKCLKDNYTFSGSCVHCDICKNYGGNLRDFVQIYQGNRPAQCSSRVTYREQQFYFDQV